MIINKTQYLYSFLSTLSFCPSFFLTAFFSIRYLKSPQVWKNRCRWGLLNPKYLWAIEIHLCYNILCGSNFTFFPFYVQCEMLCSIKNYYPRAWLVSHGSTHPWSSNKSIFQAIIQVYINETLAIIHSIHSYASWFTENSNIFLTSRI